MLEEKREALDRAISAVKQIEINPQPAHALRKIKPTQTCSIATEMLPTSAHTNLRLKRSYGLT
jgi:hypothetical protein